MTQKVLFITVVPPFPDDQGNRRVTLSLLQNLFSLGLDVDMVIQCGGDFKRMESEFGERLNYVRTRPSKDMRTSTISKARGNIDALVSSNQFEVFSEARRREIQQFAIHHHPFEYFSDESCEAVYDYIRNSQYEAIIVNYAYALRPIESLRRRRVGLPPVFVITHDALSRLDELALTYGVDMHHRACSKSVEAETLNVADYVAAISAYERDYFKQAGVDKPVLLVEYDAFRDFAQDRVEDYAFEQQRLIFSGSGNPLNVRGISRFLTLAWPSILARAPDTQLHITGGVCAELSDKVFRNVHLRGVLSYAELKETIRNSTISINPVELGTGLKIKTIEAMCVGLPVVSVSAGVEGLEEYDRKGFMRVTNWIGFADACVSLLGDKDQWRRLSRTARQIAERRFSTASVYRELNAIIGGGKPA